MPDFSFSDENPAPVPPQKAPDADEASPPAPAKTSGFQFTEPLATAPSTPAAPTPAAPKAPAPIPGPPIPILQPPTAAPTPQKAPAASSASAPPAPIAPRVPVPTAPPPTAPNAAAQTPIAPNVPVPTLANAPKVPATAIPNPAVPNPAVPNPAVPNPAVPNPAVPNAAVPNPAVPPAPARPVNAPTANAPVAPTPAPRPIQVPIAVPAPNPARLDAIEDRVEDGAPQDDFSRKIWNVGQKIKAVLDALEGPASWLLRVAVVVGFFALAYLVAATLFGGAGIKTNPQMATLTKNLDLASRVFVFSLLGAAVASLLLGYEDNRLGAIVCGIGVVLHFAMPILLKKSVGNTPAVAVVATHLRQGGYYLVMIGLVKAVCDTAIWLWNLPDRMKSRHANVGVSNQAEAKQRIIAREANMLSPCWKLPFCRESIRKQCPAFLAKTTCWKFGRGCYCDTEMISRIVRGESLELISAPTQQSRQGKPPCGRCYIYLEHQTYKFRVLSPLALPLSVLATWLVWPIYTRFFNIGNGVFNSLWSSLSFNTTGLVQGKAGVDPSKESIDAVSKLGADAENIAHIAQNMFGVLLGFMLLIYLSKFIEWAIYKAKW